jgi:azurin
MRIRHSALLFVAALACTSAAQAANTACAIDVEGQPGKKFSPDHIVVPAQCEFFTVKLIHTGKNSKEKAGHNWVLTRSEDIDQVMLDGMRAGPQTDWLQAGDGRILAKTPMLGGHETATVTFPVSRLRAGQSYTYYCSFPAHAEKMRGTLVLGQ